MNDTEKNANRYSTESRLGIFLLLMMSILIIVGSLTNTDDIENLKEENVVKHMIHRAISSIEISSGDTTKKQVIFTFDGGSGAKSGQEILATLAKHKIKGTFFLTGKFIEENIGLVKQIVKDGHEVFNHTYDHPYLTALSDADIIVELDRTNNLLSSTTGSYTRPYFRTPYGDRDARVLDVAFKHGYQSVYWTVDAHDWQETSGVTSKDVTDRIFSSLAPGNIYLMHIGDSITGNILDDVFTKIEEKGYNIVSLTQGL